MTRIDVPRSGLRERRLRRKRILLSLFAALIVLSVALVVGLTWIPFIRIHAIEVSGQKSVEKEDVLRVVEAELAGGYLYLFAKSNIFLYPKTAIRQAVLHTFPTFSKVTVSALSFQMLGVSVVERQPVALWCGESIASSTSCYLVDEAGIVFAPAVVYSGDAYQKYFGVLKGESLPRQFLDATQFHALSGLADALGQKLGLRVLDVVVDDAGDVRIVFENTFALILPLSANQGDIFERFELALHAKPFTAHKLSDFAYLDLRFGDKLYYKLKEN